MATGGLGDTLAAIRVGFQPILGTETNVVQQEMWEDITSIASKGDVYGLDVDRERKPMVYGSGMPCQKWCISGDQSGEAGEGGALYIDQAQVILGLDPEVFYLEQSPNVLAEQFAISFAKLKEQLETMYVLHMKTIRVWQFGDPQNRERLFIVGIHRKHGDKANHWKWPEPKYDKERYPIALDIAVPDEEVPKKYILKGGTADGLQLLYDVNVRLNQRVEAGTMDVIASWGYTMGHKSRPNKWQSWYGLLNTQLTSNGGGQRPMLSWKPGEELKLSRMAVPKETIAAASFSDSYEAWMRGFKDDDEFLHLCVNNAIPMGTGVALLQQIHDFMEYLEVPKDITAVNEVTVCQSEYKQRANGEWRCIHNDAVKSMLLDTGAQMTCHQSSVNKHLKGVKPSNTICAGVTGKMPGDKEGWMTLYSLNSARNLDSRAMQKLPVKTTTFTDLQHDLLSMDPLYKKQMLSLALRQPEEGPSEIYDWKDPSWTVPLRYDWRGGGGWWVDYVHEADKGKVKEYVELMQKELEYSNEASGVETRQLLRVNTFSVPAANDMLRKLVTTKQVSTIKFVNIAQATPVCDTCEEHEEEPSVTFAFHKDTTDVTQLEAIRAGIGLEPTEQITFEATHQGEVELRGVKAGLGHGLKKQPYMTFHKNHGHCGSGYHDGTKCPICVMVKGSATKYYKKYAPYKDLRPGHTWGMDGVVMSDRSIEGNKYMIVLRDLATDDYVLLALFLKSDSTRALVKRIKAMRGDPDYQCCDYPIFQNIVTDNAGEWSLKCTEFEVACEELGIKAIYTTPETSKELGYAEKNNHSVEIAIKAILMEENTPKNHWEAAMRSAEFLLRRLPTVAKSRASPKDGDCARPMELLSKGKISRRQIDKELTYFTQAGKLCMVHVPTVKGSRLEPKVRWGVAWGHYRDQTNFRCPFTGSEFRSKSFTVVEMPVNTNYIQFLQLEETQQQKALTKKSMAIKGDYTEKVDIVLPEPRKPENKGLPKTPVVRFRTSDEQGVTSSEEMDAARPLPQNKEGGAVRIYTHDDKEVLTTPEGTMVTKKKGSSSVELLPADLLAETGEINPCINIHNRPIHLDIDATIREATNTSDRGLQKNCNPDHCVMVDPERRLVSESKVDFDDLRWLVAENEGEMPRLPRKSSEDHEVDTNPVRRDGDLVSNPHIPQVHTDAEHPVVQQPKAQAAPSEYAKDLVEGSMEERCDKGKAQRSDQHTAHEWTDEQLMGAYGDAECIHTEPTVTPTEPKPQGKIGSRQAKRRDLREVLKNTSDSGGETGFAVRLEAADDILRTLAEAECKKTGINQSWSKVLRRMQIPDKIGGIYHKWLLQLQMPDGTPRFTATQLPMASNSSVAPDMPLPPPYGAEWYRLVQRKDDIQARKYREAVGMRLQEAAVSQVLREFKYGTPEQDTTISEEDVMMYLQAVEEGLQHQASVKRVNVAAKKKKTQKTNAEGKVAPKTVQEALTKLTEEEEVMWSQSFAKEFDGLNKLGVFEHDLTREELKKRGVCNWQNPIPMSVVLCFKYDQDGNINRYKTRMALAGHKGNMQKGVHYDKTYASCPDPHATRMLQAMVVRYGMIRAAFDIEQAYCQAPMPENEQVAVRYPKGFQRVHPVTGEELFMLLVRNLYGHPSGGRHWEKERNSVLTEEFSKDRFTITKCVKEPCMFIIRREKEYAFMLLHTDDADCAGTSNAFLKEVIDKVKKHWGIKEINPDFMLGVKRTLTFPTVGGMSDPTIEMTMTAFVESMALAFPEYVLDKKKLGKLKTPTEKGLHLHKHLKQDEASKVVQEAEAEIIRERGYSKLLGMVLWAARMCFPECLVGASMLGRQMASPTEEAWNAGINLMNWMIQNKLRGIKFSAKGNSVPVAFVDASNKPDPTDGKCQYGYVIMWMGGPIVTVSKKLAHVGLSAAHNEYMAMHWANRKIAWMRDFLREMALTDVVELPTLNCGDNQAALILSEEDIVTTGNQFIQVPYHYNKEIAEMGESKHVYVPTLLNLADVFTKCVTPQVIKDLLPQVLGYEPCQFAIDQLVKQRQNLKQEKQTMFCRLLYSELGEVKLLFKDDYGEPELYDRC
jgi:site-specific DNA-cytosine methylase